MYLISLVSSSSNHTKPKTLNSKQLSTNSNKAINDVSCLLNLTSHSQKMCEFKKKNPLKHNNLFGYDIKSLKQTTRPNNVHSNIPKSTHKIVNDSKGNSNQTIQNHVKMENLTPIQTYPLYNANPFTKKLL